MTVMDTLSTLLGTIGGITVNQPKLPRAAAVKVLPAVEVFSVSDVGEYHLDGSTICHHERFQVNMAASTYAGLETLIGQVYAKLDNNHTNFINSKPAGRGPTGYDDNPQTHWTSADWLIFY